MLKPSIAEGRQPLAAGAARQVQRVRDLARRPGEYHPPMNRSTEQSVLVHAFRCFDIDAGAVIVPPFKATEQAIRHHFNGEPLPLTAESVDAAELDAEGRWFRLATGWGALG
jgi:hypothetical protein